MIPFNIKQDFERKVVCLLGIPFDVVSLHDVIKQINQSSAEQSRCILSTPNVNFVINSLQDDAFLKSVINSDLNIVDGMPLVWCAGLLGLPLKERVAGSDLLEYLYLKQKDRVTRVFFFGGEKGVAEKASDVVNKANKGIRATGFFGPGFTCIENMSSAGIIETINSSHADFLILALGAQKGQSWIEKNKSLITIPVISHLGAALNFITGSVKRSPVFFQKTGLEWLWRIYQEPALWKRYFFDAVQLAQLFLFRILPYAVWLRSPGLRKSKQQTTDAVFNYSLSDKDNRLCLLLSGSLKVSHVDDITQVLYKAYQQSKNIELDFTQVTYIDSFIIAKLYILKKHCAADHLSIQLVNLPDTIKKIFYWNCAEVLL